VRTKTAPTRGVDVCAGCGARDCFNVCCHPSNRLRAKIPRTDEQKRIKIVKDPAVSGYAHAFVLMKPWTIYIDRKPLLDKGGRPRRFSTEHAALAAARRSIA
jgi:hypothetical protein